MFMGRDTEYQEDWCIAIYLLLLVPLALLISPLHMLAQHIAMLTFLTMISWKMSYT